MKSEKQIYFSVRSAAFILGIKSLAYARKILGAPDVIEQRKSGHKNLYSAEHIERTRAELQQSRIDRMNNKGKRGCYHCRRKFDPGELKSGICADCQAWRTVLNFSCHGDCTKCPVDCKRLKCLKNAITKMERRLELFYR